MSKPSRRAVRGSTLVEALIALLVASLGVVALGRVHGALRREADIARDRGDAALLARGEIESLRGYASLAADPGRPSFDDVTGVAPRPVAQAATVFSVERSIEAAELSGLRLAQVRASWTDRAAGRQSVTLVGAVVGVEPSLAGRLLLALQAAPHARPYGRHASITPGAPALDPGRSLAPLAAAGAPAWVVDDGSGDVVEKCTLAAGADARAPRPSDLLDCTPVRGHLVEGWVRFATDSTATAADARAPRSLARLLHMTLDLETPGAAAVCVDDAETAAGSRGAVHYACLVVTDQPTWSGRLSAMPVGWAWGMTAGRFRLCRYSADHDRSGAIDNAEHPARYRDAGARLPAQNFLVVRGEVGCPLDDSVDGWDASTQPHEPA